MGSQRKREERRPVRLQAKLRNDVGWRDAVIANVSSRGVMLRCAQAPAKGTFIELRCRSTCIVGRVVWSDGNRCGVRTQDRVDFQLLTGLSTRNSEDPNSAIEAAPPQAVRFRTTVRSADANRHLAKILQWVAVAVAGALAASVLAETVSSTFEASIGKASIELGTGQSADDPQGS